MPYVCFTTHFTTMLFFCEDIPGSFTISMDPEKAKTFKTRKEARTACKVYQELSKMKCKVLRT